jgi:hypothetical protein
MTLSGEQVWGRRAREAFERGRTPLEGVSSPRARRSLTRGGDRSSSEAGSHPRGRLTLQRGKTSLEEASSPRAGRKSTSGASCPSSEVEFRLRVDELSAWWAAVVTRAVGPAVGLWVYLKHVLGSFAFCFCERKWVSPGCLGDPYGCTRL